LLESDCCTGLEGFRMESWWGLVSCWFWILAVQ
jgi:hypothetical protein